MFAYCQRYFTAIGEHIRPRSAIVIGKIQSIQVLRGIAAFMVMIFHLRPDFDVGQAAVDVFFVISGFIMGTVGVNERPGEFLNKRIARIAPLYWIITIAMCIGARLGLFRNFTFDASRLLLSLFFIPYFNEHGLLYPLLVPGWSLDYEMLFYLIFAAGLWWGRPLPTTLITLVGLIGLGAIVKPHSAIGMTWTSPLLLEFLAGVLLSQVQNRLPGAAVGLLLAAIGIAGLAMAGPLRHMLGGEYRVVTWGIPSFAIVSGALMIEYGGLWPGKFIWPLNKLGDISYSLYLVHTLVISIGHRILGDRLWASLLIVAVAVGAGFGCFHFVEKPLARQTRKLFSGLAGIMP